MANSSSSASSGIGLFGLTFVTLLVLKLGGWANISWFIVFLPLIIGFAIGFIVLVSIGIVAWIATR